QLAGGGQILRSRGAVVDGDARALSMRARGGNIVFRWIDADHLRAQSRQRLRQNTATAADIEDAQTLQTVEFSWIAIEMCRGLVSDITEANWIEFMQRRHGPARIPPVGGVTREPLDLGLIDRRRVTLDCHACLRPPRYQRAVT